MEYLQMEYPQIEYLQMEYPLVIKRVGGVDISILR